MPVSKPEDYERVSVYQLDPETREKLLSLATECVFNWCTKDAWPMGVVMSCLWRDGRMWLTTGAHRHRVSAVRRNPKVSVVVTSSGTELGPGRTVTIKGTCRILEDRETKDWFYPAFARHTTIGDPSGAGAFAKSLDSPLRVVLEVTPEKFITYDGIKMFKHTAGVLDESELSEPASSDAVRMQQELERRGLA